MKTTTLANAEPTIRFQATLATGETAGEACFSIPVPLPKELSGSTSMIEGTAAGFPFRAPFDSARQRLKLSPTLQKAMGVSAGDVVSVEITRIGESPEVMVPADLTVALAASPQAHSLWNEITPMARREWVRWIASAKQEKTREKRIEVGIDKLLHGMRRPCCFPGLNWVTKDHVDPEETWSTLPSSKKPTNP